MEGNGLLSTADDWQLLASRSQGLHTVFVGNAYYQPETRYWHLVLSLRLAILMEVTVALEEKIEEVYERKRSKYQDRVEDCQQRGWGVFCLPVEMRCEVLWGSQYGGLCWSSVSF